MKRLSSRHLGIVLVVVTIALAGCGGGDGGATTPTETSAVETETATATEAGGEETPTATGDGGDQTSTATVTPGSGFDAGSHSAGLREAGSYTVRITGTMMTGGGSSVDTVNVTQKRIVATNEGYSRWEAQSTSFEYYQPPDSTTAYLHVSGQTQEVSSDQAFLMDYTAFTTDTTSSGGVLSGFSGAGETRSGSTALGPATVYVIDSPDQLPASARTAYDQINSVRYRVWVDDDTGIVAKYDYRLEVVQDGEELSLEGSVELVDLGSTTIERPDWAP